MFHLGFGSGAKTIAALEGQMSFHVRGPRASEGAGGRQRGQMAVQKQQKATLVMCLYKGALMWKQLWRTVASPVSSSETKTFLLQDSELQQYI